AVKQYKDITDSLGLELIRITLPYELKKNELTAINTFGIDTELVVRGRIPLMVSEQCVRRTYDLCDKANGTIYIKDAKGQANKVCSYCDYCYSVIYSDIYDISKEDYSEIAPDYIRYESVDEECENMTGKVFDGHFNVGVE
ncbi:MAG: hypothetical protein IJB96_10490, partial [Lachnospira sp.]|nr:hypothetical protein [Lachnospira sp.]